MFYVICDINFILITLPHLKASVIIYVCTLSTLYDTWHIVGTQSTFEMNELTD